MITITRFRVPLGKGRHPHREVAQAAHQGHQLVRVVEPVGCGRPRCPRSAGRITAQCEHIRDSGGGVCSDYGLEFIDAGSNAGQMPERSERRLGGHALGEPDSAIPGRSACSIGDRGEGRMQRLQLTQGLPQFALPLIGLRREELERERPPSARKQCTDVVMTLHAVRVVGRGRGSLHRWSLAPHAGDTRSP